MRKNKIFKLIWDRAFEFFYACIIMWAMYIGTQWLTDNGYRDYSAYLTGFGIMFFMFSIGRLFRRDSK